MSKETTAANGKPKGLLWRDSSYAHDGLAGGGGGGSTASMDLTPWLHQEIRKSTKESLTKIFGVTIFFGIKN
ncbi:hypothetical protein N7508_007353 [Penicillium antarcticum]|uniref:uncharacterized protein n=1 Tax=Penicillium antarcticum TaxID=416450 RepID=UPI0023A66822|nr:uncharacterized protein N7508_007353 [Penicillium antarcticum]KAJ5300110.1 hypothetical protein N7508_007353 [Penicillium antarcticum]